MSRRPLIAGNWKMFKNREEARKTVGQLQDLLAASLAVDVVVCPPFSALSAVEEVIRGGEVQLAAQNVHWEEEGAFTGEVSTSMLLDCGCRYVILGHSERRQLFHESDAIIHRKMKKVLETELTPILCVGESLEEREAQRVGEVIRGQLEADLGALTAPEASRIIVAYEPIWAIGTGKTATPEMAQEVHGLIRQWLSERYSDPVAGGIRILYGGSVKPDNARELLAQEDIDGALVGGASLDAQSFATIVQESA
ncbi:MAG: triose-phosphate isomerase [Acidobacteriota bacterium]